MMNGPKSLSRTLQWLKLLKKHSSCHIIVNPDPRNYMGLDRLATGRLEFHLKFERDLNLNQYISHYPFYGVASNGGHTVSHLFKSNQPNRSEWVKIMDINQKTPDGNTLQDVLSDILDKFPNYELHSEKDIAEAIGDIEASLNPIATFDEVKNRGQVIH